MLQGALCCTSCLDNAFYLVGSMTYMAEKPVRMKIDEEKLKKAKKLAIDKNLDPNRDLGILFTWALDYYMDPNSTAQKPTIANQSLQANSQSTENTQEVLAEQKDEHTRRVDESAMNP